MNDNTDPPIEQLAETAVAAARAAGAVLLQHWSQNLHVQFKGDIDLVTDADRRSEETIVTMLRARFPDHQILAEEGSTGGSSPTYRWVVDPLDGTTNFAHGYPHFAVSVAVERQGKPIAGVVYDPILDEMFTARLGEGAFLNGRPIHVSPVDSLLRAMLSTGFPYDRRLFGASLAWWDYFVRRAQAVRRDGSAALDICYVAAGRFDAFWEDRLWLWDVAAAMLVAREAGGQVTDFRGGEFDPAEGKIVASNGHLHAAMLSGLASCEGTRSRRVPRRSRGGGAHSRE